MKRLLLAFSVITLAASCRDANGPSRIQAFTSLSLGTINEGDWVDVTITVVNTTNRPERVWDMDCEWAFLVEDLAGAPVGQGQRCFLLMVADSITLGPGQSYSRTVAWRPRRFVSADAPTVLLSPGVYRVRPNEKLIGPPVTHAAHATLTIK